MRIIQQNNWSCVACVAAMATGTNLVDFIRFVGHDGDRFSSSSKHPEGRRGFSLQEFLGYLLDHDMCAGACGDRCQPNPYQDEFVIEVKLSNPAMVTVRGNLNMTARHVIYWNGREILDPNPDAANNPPWSNYEVLEWWPIYKIQNS